MPLTSCKQEVSLSSFFENWNADGGTALYDSIHWALQSLTSWRANNPGEASEKAQLVVLTDGEDTESKMSISAVQKSILASRPIQVVLVGIGHTGNQLKRLAMGPEGSLAELVEDEGNNGDAVDRSLRRVRDADRDRVESHQAQTVATVYPRDRARSRSRSRSRSPPRRANRGGSPSPPPQAGGGVRGISLPRGSSRSLSPRRRRRSVSRPRNGRRFRRSRSRSLSRSRS